MTRRGRFGMAISVAILALTIGVSSAFAAVTFSYTSTLSMTSPNYGGPYRTYSGHHIAIQTTMASSVNGTYTIEVERQDCLLGVCWGTLVGSAGSCPYIGFCGLSWAIDLGNGQNKFAFYFKKANDGHNIHTNSFQMWSTEP